MACAGIRSRPSYLTICGLTQNDIRQLQQNICIAAESGINVWLSLLKCRHMFPGETIYNHASYESVTIHGDAMLHSMSSVGQITRTVQCEMNRASHYISIHATNCDGLKTGRRRERWTRLIKDRSLVEPNSLPSSLFASYRASDTHNPLKPPEKPPHSHSERPCYFLFASGATLFSYICQSTFMTTEQGQRET